MPSLLNTCDTCASLLLSSCEDILIAAGLDGDTAYWWIVTDQHGNRWKAQATTDINGVLTIPEDSFPAGMFTSGIGELTIQIKAGEDDLENIPLSIGYALYDCLTVSFAQDQPIGYGV